MSDMSYETLSCGEKTGLRGGAPRGEQGQRGDTSCLLHHMTTGHVHLVLFEGRTNAWNNIIQRGNTGLEEVGNGLASVVGETGPSHWLFSLTNESTRRGDHGVFVHHERRRLLDQMIL